MHLPEAVCRFSMDAPSGGLAHAARVYTALRREIVRTSPRLLWLIHRVRRQLCPLKTRAPTAWALTSGRAGAVTLRHRAPTQCRIIFFVFHSSIIFLHVFSLSFFTSDWVYKLYHPANGTNYFSPHTFSSLQFNRFFRGGGPAEASYAYGHQRNADPRWEAP